MNFWTPVCLTTTAILRMFNRIVREQVAGPEAEHDTHLREPTLVK
jgi:hypothetical protein